MTHVTDGTNTSVSSSRTTQQTEKTDNQSEMLFDSLFSIVSELDSETVELIANKLSQKNQIAASLDTDEENTLLLNKTNLEQEEFGLSKNASTIGIPHDRGMEMLSSLLDKKRLIEGSNEKSSIDNDLFSELTYQSYNLSNTSISSQEMTTKKSSSHLFTNQPIAYMSTNMNFLGPNKLQNNPNDPIGSEKLLKVVKLIEQVINLKESKHTVSNPLTEKLSNTATRETEPSALDEAMEVLSELKNIRKGNIGIENLSRPKKADFAITSKNSLDNKDTSIIQEYKNMAVKQSSLTNPDNKNHSLENKLGSLTRQVELSQQSNTNSVNQTNIQLNGLDIHSGDTSGQDGNENRQSTQPLRASSHLSTFQKLNMADKAWKEALVRKVEMQLKEGSKTLDISLNPKQLGRMTVSINISGDDASVQISTETSSAANILLESESKLAQMMQEIGLRLNLLQANLSGKHEKQTKQDENGKNLAKKTPDPSTDGNGLNETDFKKLDNSILNIVA